VKEACFHPGPYSHTLPSRREESPESKNSWLEPARKK